MVGMIVPVGEGDGLVADVADRTGRGPKSGHSVEHPVFNRRCRRRKELSAGVQIGDPTWVQDLRVDVVGTWGSR
jgi:hypothetical protein